MVRVGLAARRPAHALLGAGVLALGVIVLCGNQLRTASPVLLAQWHTDASPARAAAGAQGADGGDLTKALAGMGAVVERSAGALEGRAAALRARAAQAGREAKEERDAKGMLTRAQSELNAYAVNLEGMMEAGRDGGLTKGDLSRFPREAANLHALLDLSMSSADALAVRMARGEAAPASPVRGGDAGKGEKGGDEDQDALKAKRAAQERFAAFSHTMPYMAAEPLQPAFPPSAWEPKALTRAGHTHDAAQPRVRAIMRKLRRVKSFAKVAGGSEKQIEAAGVETMLVQPAPLVGAMPVREGKQIEAPGVETMLVQPAPLVGAMPVREGELYRKGTLYNPEQVTEPEGEQEEEEDEEINEIKKLNENTTLTADEVIRACNSTCQELVLHSTLGLAFKVAAKCVPDCANGPYMLEKHGEPLLLWRTVDELKAQDKECQEVESYLECKLEALEPACGKLIDVMPQYCLEHPHEGICVQCVQMEEFTMRKEEAARAKQGGGGGGCLMGVLC